MEGCRKNVDPPGEHEATLDSKDCLRWRSRDRECVCAAATPGEQRCARLVADANRGSERKRKRKRKRERRL